MPGNDHSPGAPGTLPSGFQVIVISASTGLGAPAGSVVIVGAGTVFSRTETVLAEATDSPGTGPESGYCGFRDLSDEQLNVAVLALLEEKWIALDGDGRYRRAPGDLGTRRLSLKTMFERRDGVWIMKSK